MLAQKKLVDSDGMDYGDDVDITAVFSPELRLENCDQCLPNIITDVIMSKVTPNEYMVLSYICRLYIEDVAAEEVQNYRSFSLSHLVHGEKADDGTLISNGLWLTRAEIIPALRLLVAQKIVFKHKRTRTQNARHSSSYSFNDNAADWVFLPKPTPPQVDVSLCAGADYDDYDDYDLDTDDTAEEN